MAARLDPGAINGGPFLGLNGLVVKSHGGATADSFATAVRLAVSLADSDFVAEISQNLNRPACQPARERTVA
jgi:glycerol-3-phosphate acyltransferase PlsX